MNRELEQFFTTSDVSNLIASRLIGAAPRTVVDVGAGEGALLKAVKNRWKKVRLLGVDIDPNMKRKGVGDDIERIMADGLDHTLPAFLAECYGKIDLAVSNPPYTRIKGSPDTELILKEAGLFESIGKSKSYPAEVVFLAQNLRILQKSGRLAIIIPSGIVNNDRWAKLRYLLCKLHRIEMVIELPDNSFAQTEAKTFVIILRKGGETESVRLFEVKKSGKLSRQKIISVEQANHRMDWSYYAWMSASNAEKRSGFTLRELGATIFRGQLSLSSAKDLNVSIFHSSDISDKPRRVVIDAPMTATDSQHVIQAGDILVCRVGSRCIGRRCYVTSGEAIVSDSVFVVRLDKKYQHYAWRYLSSDEAFENILNLARGVCAKYITKEQLLDLLIY